jgi:hypothetical protein
VASNQIKHVSELNKKSNEYGRTIMASPVVQVNNWIAYYVTYLPQLTFVLPTCYLTKDDK